MSKNDNIKATVIRKFLIIIFVWTLMIGLSLFLNIQNEKQQSHTLALNAARAYFNKDEAIRNWATKHGGVYVPPTKNTPPNPYLAHLKNRDVVTQNGVKLTLMNPAYMIRDMMDDYAKLYGVSGRIVGLLPLNPNNLADKWESKAIKKFISGEASEIIETQIYKGEEQLRLIKPYYMQPGCVACHGYTGLKDQDVAGGIGISIPLKPYKDVGEKGVRDMYISHFFIYILGLMGIVMFSKNIYTMLKERQNASDKLKKLNANLDKQVKERTSELEGSLHDLKQTQKRLIETEKMSALGSLVAGVAHEINTPIGNALTGSTHIQFETSLLQESIKDNKLTKTALAEYLDTMKQASASMHISLKSAVSLIRSFKQVAIDQHVEQKRNFNLKIYCDEVLLSLYNQTKTKNLEIINNIDSSIELHSYAGIFSQAITNFVMNTSVHGFGEGHEAIKIIIFASIIKDELIFTYEDDGVGIEEKNLSKIFDPFFTTKLGQGGSGLGLNIIYNLINHKLKGSIEAKSTVGSGMKIFIKIPMSELTQKDT